MQVHQGAASGLEAAQGRPAAGGGQEAAVQCEQAGPHQVCHVLHGGVRDEVSLTLPVQPPSGLLPNDLVILMRILELYCSWLLAVMASKDCFVQQS